MITLRRTLPWLLVAGLLAGAAGYLVLISPDNPLTRAFQRKITDVDARIVIGPYPVERDFRLLRKHQVTLVVSLLDPAIPYEKTLLEQERKLAATYGMRLVSCPMSSILGRRFGGHYDRSAADAVTAITGTPEKVYLHCYLGLHRVQVVRDLLAAHGVSAAAYRVRQGERQPSQRILDAAESAFNGQRYAEALAALAQLAPAELSPAARSLQAWSHYRLGQVPAAAAAFAALRQISPRDPGPIVGAGYCALRTGDVRAAEAAFREALQLAPDHADALGGLGLACYQQGRLDAAAQRLDASLRLAPDNQELRAVRERIRAGAPTPAPAGR
jgi:tetratricopeptide (TPR) repeat protein